MKKLICLLSAVIMAVCMCIPLAACGNNTESPIKRIIGLDSEKTYVKGKFYVENQFALNEKEMDLEILSYDKIENNELENVVFVVENNNAAVLNVDSFKLIYRHEINGIYYYRLELNLRAKFVSHFKAEKMILTISGKEYNFSCDLFFQVYTNFIYVGPNSYYVSEGDPVKGAYCTSIVVPYDMMLKSLKFQTEGFDIISYYIDKCEGFDYEKWQATYVKVSEELPVTLEAEKTYEIYVEAVPPDDCLYYSDSMEAIVEIQGVEIFYSDNSSSLNFYTFKGSAISSDFDEEEYE